MRAGVHLVSAKKIRGTAGVVHELFGLESKTAVRARLLQQRASGGMGWPLQEARRAFFGDGAVGQDDHAIREVPGEVGVVGRDQQPPPFSGEPLENLSERTATRRIERGGRLVQEKERRIHGQRPSNGDTLRLASRKLPRVCPGTGTHAEGVENPLPSRSRLAGLVPEDSDGSEDDVLESRQVLEERVGLEDHPDLSPQRLESRLGGDGARRENEVLHFNAARLEAFEGGGGAQDRRLSRSREPHEGDELPALDGESDPAQHLPTGAREPEAFDPEQAVYDHRRSRSRATRERGSDMAR